MLAPRSGKEAGEKKPEKHTAHGDIEVCTDPGMAQATSVPDWHTRL